MIFSFSVMTSVMPESIQAVPETGTFPPELVAAMKKLMLFGMAASLAVFAYLVIMEAWIGATLGKWVVGIRTIDLSSPEQRGLPFSKALLRELTKVAGGIPSVIWSGITLFMLSGVTDFASFVAKTQGGSFLLQAVLQFLPLVWLAWIGVSLVNKRDPIYDRVAGTAVIRVAGA